MTSEIFIVSLVFLGLSFLVSAVLKSKFKKYSKMGLASGLSGREIAEKMLRENAIYDVKVISVDGFLSDHYNPVNRTVNLSPDVYNGTSISAAAVAAHECGHVVQHATQYDGAGCSVEFHAGQLDFAGRYGGLGQYEESDHFTGGYYYYGRYSIIYPGNPSG